MSVHYKFKSALEYDTVTFDGLHISVRDLKNSIMQQKRIGKNTDFDLQVTNAQTKEVYDNDEALIPKNTSLLIARIPSTQSKQKTWEGYGGTSSPVPKVDDGGPIAKAMDLSSLDASEEDKIKAMMSQSTQDYDPSNYLKIRGANQMGAVPPNYRCFKCHQGGHWIKDCPLSQGTEPLEIKKSTGIPRSFMVPVEGPQVPGAMMTPNGSFAVPVLDHQAYNEKPQPAPPEEKRPEIPDDLLCSLCSDLLTDAVMIPCCGDSFCDECIRSCLLESEEHECPACHERDISPGTLIPNRYLRNSVANFKNTTGYVKRLVYKPPPTPVKEVLQTNIEHEKEPDLKQTENNKEASPPPVPKTETGEKTIISEADSTEPPKSVPRDKVDFTEDIDLKDPPKNSTPTIPEGPPGVSPKHEQSPKVQTITNVANAPRNVRSHKSSHERSPRRPHHVHQSPSYQEPMRNEDRPGTPTVDEPGGISANSMDGPYPPGPHYGGPPPVLSSMMGMPPPNIQGPPPIMPSYGPQPLPSVYPPPNQGPPPNFRLPPPGAPPYIQPGYNAPPRPVFECARPPLSGPPSFPPLYSSGPRPSRGRDYPRDIPRRGRTPPRIIDDPLEAFNRMLREKDERERRAKQRKGRSYSRSSSRSFSRSPRRIRSRSPRRRSRSRSRSFTMSRSRSRSFSPSPRASPIRQYSPKRSPHRRGHSRFRSPIRSPLPRYRYKEQPIERERERGRDREYERDRDRERDRDKEFRDRERDNRGYSRERDYRDREPRDRDRDFQYYEGYERERGRGRSQWSQSVARKEYPGPEAYYHPPDMASQAPPYVPPNRYPPRDMYLPPHHLPPVQHPPVLHPHPPQMLPPIRRYEDVAPPGTEQPPVPGLENTPRIEERYMYEPGDKFSPPREKREDRERVRDDREDFVKHDRRSRSPEKRFPSPRKQSKERDYQATPEKKRRRREESSERDKKESEREKHDRRRDPSDDEKTKKNKDKKKKKEKREKKEEEKKKRREKREKREQDKLKKEEKEKVEKRHKDDKKEIVVYEKEREASDEKKYKVPIPEEYKDEKKSKEMTPEKLVKDKDEAKGKQENVVDFKPLDVKIAEPKEQKKAKDYKVKEDEDVPKRKVESNKETKKEQTAADLYGDLLSEGIDNTVIQNYGKIKDLQDSIPKTEEVISEKTKDSKYDEIIPSESEQKAEVSEDEESEKDILELHTNEADLKADLDSKSEVLVPLPERSKWEVDEDVSVTPNSKQDTKAERVEKAGKVTTEVLKRAENAIFAKAINAIRPIEIKKISLDRAKLYSGERDRDKKLDDPRNIHVTIHSGFDDDVVAVEPDLSALSKPRLSVKERLGCKVDDLDRIVKVDKPYDRNRSRSLSPLSRRAGDLSRNLGQGERRIEIEERRRSNSKSRYSDKSRDRHRRYRAEREPRRDSRGRKDERDSKREPHKDTRRDRDRESKKEEVKKDERKEKVRSRSRGRPTEKYEEDRKARDKKRSRSRTSSHGKSKRKDKKEKRKEKSKKHKKDDDEKDASKGAKNDDESKESKEKPKLTTEKRKATLDEANFEPDYDLETESEKEEIKKEEKAKKRSKTKSPEIEVPKKRLRIDTKSDDSSSSSSDSSSEDDRKRKKHRKHKKKKSRKESSSSSSSESESDSSEDERDRKRKKHKKKQKKRKKSKHK